MTQCERILWHMENKGPITCKQAADDYGIMALHSRISDLRKQGYDIKKTYQYGFNRFGERCSWYSYELEQA